MESGLKVDSLGFTPTLVVNKFHKTPFDVYVGRGSKWGNPYPLTGSSREEKLESRKVVIRRFEEYFLATSDLLDSVVSLQGKRLQCFCAPLPCHADVLAFYADAIYLFGELPEQSAFSILYPEG